ncbi:Derlin 1 [Cichlidogyrus casuarinus]|uniref:Derlin n=1 Tax=Cichlidogyrus casuarinus TaxID=1844966 RepID=A0ABD2QNR6_9PLAT
MAGNEFSDFIKSIPFLTRYWFCATIILSLSERLGLISPYWLILDSEAIFYKFQIWRPLTALLFFPIRKSTAFHFMINLYFMYSYSTRLENENFAGRRADYAFLLAFAWFCLALLGIMFEMPYFMEAMVIAVLYIWCQHNRETIVQFWFGTSFKAAYLPWVLLAFDFLVNGQFQGPLFGILVGHAFYFFNHQYPSEFGGSCLLKTPAFFYSLFATSGPVQTGFAGPQNFGQRPSSSTGATLLNRRFPGSGNRLGD